MGDELDLTKDDLYEALRRRQAELDEQIKAGDELYKTKLAESEKVPETSIQQSLLEGLLSLAPIIAGHAIAGNRGGLAGSSAAEAALNDYRSREKNQVLNESLKAKNSANSLFKDVEDKRQYRKELEKAMLTGQVKQDVVKTQEEGKNTRQQKELDAESDLVDKKLDAEMKRLQKKLDFEKLDSQEDRKIRKEIAEMQQTRQDLRSKETQKAALDRAYVFVNRRNISGDSFKIYDSNGREVEFIQNKVATDNKADQDYMNKVKTVAEAHSGLNKTIESSLNTLPRSNMLSRITPEAEDYGKLRSDYESLIGDIIAIEQARTGKIYSAKQVEAIARAKVPKLYGIFANFAENAPIEGARKFEEALNEVRNYYNDTLMPYYGRNFVVAGDKNEAPNPKQNEVVDDTISKLEKVSDQAKQQIGGQQDDKTPVDPLFENANRFSDEELRSHGFSDSDIARVRRGGK